MNEILRMLNELKADELDKVIMRANILLEKKRQGLGLPDRLYLKNIFTPEAH